MRGVVIVGWLCGAALLGCEDKARQPYGECAAAESKGDFLAAAEACEAAVKADAVGPSGKAAAEKLKAMQPSIAKARAEKNAADEKKRQAEEDAAKAATAAQAAKVAQLKARAKFEPTGESDKCVSDGKPRRGVAITGGTYDDNEAVATSMGCVRSHVYYPQQGHSAIDNNYCCP